MPTWALVLGLSFSGVIALITMINFFNSASKESTSRIEVRLDKLIDRFDRHLESHP
jgi:hypothetical protein